MACRRFSKRIGSQFVINVEAMPPASYSADLGAKLRDSLQDLPIDAINLADSPMARPRMSPPLFSSVIKADCGERFEFIPHVNVRDRNRVALQGLIWGIVATGAKSVLIVSGDSVRHSNDHEAVQVVDLTVPDLVRMAREAELIAGVVMDPRPAQAESERRKLETKLDAGAGFIITQPLYDVKELDSFVRAVEDYDVPVLLGVLPLVSIRHARFLDRRVPGISVPAHVIDALELVAADDMPAFGIDNARTMLTEARQRMAGVCIMPPFNRFDLVADILK